SRMACYRTDIIPISAVNRINTVGAIKSILSRSTFDIIVPGWSEACDYKRVGRSSGAGKSCVIGTSQEIITLATIQLVGIGVTSHRIVTVATIVVDKSTGLRVVDVSTIEVCHDF